MFLHSLVVCIVDQLDMQASVPAQHLMSDRLSELGVVLAGTQVCRPRIDQDDVAQLYTSTNLCVLLFKRPRETQDTAYIWT